MSDFSDFKDLYDPLVLPINGKSYTIPPVSFEAGVRINGILDGTKKGREGTADEEFYRLILGDVFDEMVSDSVPVVAISRAMGAALADFKYGRDFAALMWKTGDDPKALKALAPTSPPAPNRAAKRSKSTAAATKTP